MKQNLHSGVLKKFQNKRFMKQTHTKTGEHIDIISYEILSPNGIRSIKILVIKNVDDKY